MKKKTLRESIRHLIRHVKQKRLDEEEQLELDYSNHLWTKMKLQEA